MVIWIGLLIGFWGYLMVGNINLSVIELSIQPNKSKLIVFVLLAILFEFVYCFGTLYGLKFLVAYPDVIRIAQYLSVVFLIALGLWSLLEKPKDPNQQRANIVRRGYVSMVFHPQQIPFWFFWGFILIDKKWLFPEFYSILFFSAGNIIGGAIVLLMYAFFGNKIISLLRLNHKHLKNIVGIICLASAGILLVDIFR